jgi:hypothetical protein
MPDVMKTRDNDSVKVWRTYQEIPENAKATSGGPSEAVRLCGGLQKNVPFLLRYLLFSNQQMRVVPLTAIP